MIESIDSFLISNHVVNKVIDKTFVETKNPSATTDVYVKPGEYHVNFFSQDHDDNLFSEDHDKNLFGEDCKESVITTGRCVQDLFEGRDHKVFANSLVISRPNYQWNHPRTEVA